MPHDESKTLISTECEAIYAGTPQVCVYVCTDITSVYAAEELISEDANSYEMDCPDQQIGLVQPTCILHICINVFIPRYKSTVNNIDQVYNSMCYNFTS